MSWENSLAYACLSENFFNLFCMVFMANEMYQLSENEKLKFLTMQNRRTALLVLIV